MNCGLAYSLWVGLEEVRRTRGLSATGGATVVENRGTSDDALGHACERLFDRIDTALALLSVPLEVQCAVAERYGATSGDPVGLCSTNLRIALPRFDTKAQLAGAGSRSADQPASSRQVVYQSDTIEIALSMHRASGDARLDVNGQVFPTNGSTMLTYDAVLLRGKHEAGTAETDALGEFSFKDVSQGEYFVLLTADGMDVWIVPLEVAV